MCMESEKGRNMIQVPSYEVRQALATGRLLPNQTLLIDPYFQSTTTAKPKSNDSLLSKFPYVQVAFEEAEKPAEPIRVNTLVLVRAQQLKSKQDQSQAK